MTQPVPFSPAPLLDSSAGYLVGVAVLIQNALGQVLLGLRTKDQLWASFGGRLERIETAEQGARREVLEEVGLRLGGLTPLTFGEGVKADGSRYVTLYFRAECPADQMPANVEPAVTTELRWFDVDALPGNMWERERTLILRL